MSDIDFENITPESRHAAIKDMMHTAGWSILCYEWAHKRERIIAEGKSSRANEKQVKIWAKLDGFDECANLVEKLLIVGRISELNPLGEGQ